MKKYTNEDIIGPGFYWVRLSGAEFWTIGQYEPYLDGLKELPEEYPWQVIGYDDCIKDSDIAEIGDRIERKR